MSQIPNEASKMKSFEVIEIPEVVPHQSTQKYQEAYFLNGNLLPAKLKTQKI
jgi:hypothetical protein